MVKMLERLQSALKTVKESKPGSLMTHRFVTVRRGSPAARSGHIQPGDHLEGVEGRPVGGLQHRDLAQILRRAGNTLRLTIAPRHNAAVTEGADLDIDGRVIRSSRSRAKEEGRFYSVDLERGPTGFGFSLRGGSEYNMGLYVLGLMQGGPAQRSNKIQVSDQLVEINGDSTAGMTHSQAVDQIRRGGNHIHLVLKRGNGYVPDYGPEEGALSPSTPPPPQEQPEEAVTTTTARAPVTTTTASSSSIISRSTAAAARPGGGGGGGGGEGGERSKRKKSREETRAKPRPAAPDLDLDAVDEEQRQKQSQKHRGRSRRNQEEEEERGRSSRSLPRNRAPSWHRGAEEEEGVQKNQEERGRSGRSLPRNRAPSWDRGAEEEGVGLEVTEKKRRTKRKEADILREDVKAEENGRRSKRAVSEPFSFLMARHHDDDDDSDHARDQQPPSDSESAASFSEVSQSAASIAWREESDWRRAGRSGAGPGEDSDSPPGPWLKPSAQKLTRVLIGSRLSGRSLAGGLSL